MTAVTIGDKAVALRPRANLARTTAPESWDDDVDDGAVTGSAAPGILGKLSFFGVVRIGLTRVIWNPIIKDASHKLNAVLSKSFLDRKQGITRSLARARYEHHTVRQNSDHAGIRDRQCWRSI